MEQHTLLKLLEDVSHSDLYKEYEQAFKEVTHLPLHIRSLNDGGTVAHDRSVENPFCHFMRQHNESCRTCLHMNGAEPAGTVDHTCFAGIHVTGVPIRLHDQVIGYLQTGEVLLSQPTEEQLTATTKQLLDWGLTSNPDDMHDLIRAGHILSPKQYEAVVRLLEIFSRHISALAEKLSVTSEYHVPEGIRKSRDYITDNLDSRLTLDRVAMVANMSAAHFCRMFKKATGMNFSEYVNRLRIEKAKRLMRSTGMTISQVAYEVGFNSVTHFNRIFRKITDSTPTEYRHMV